MLRKKLFVRFAFQIMVVGILLIGIAVAILVWMIKEFSNIELQRQFSPSGISKLISEATVDEQGYITNSDLLELLEDDGGWLQSLDENGNVIQSFFTPDDVPTSYEPALLIDYWLGKKPFPYSLGLWIQTKGDYTFTMLYGKKYQSPPSLKPLIEDATITNHTIQFSETYFSQLNNTNSWVQVFNEQGSEIASWNKPDYAQDHYSLKELALRSSYYVDYGIAIDSEYDEQTGLTWIVQYPIVNDDVSTRLLPNVSPELELIIKAALLFLISSLIIFIVLAIWYANRFMNPIMEIVRHIQQLGQDKPLDKVKNRRSKKALFSEVIQTIGSVEERLQATKQAELKTQSYREEWIAGVTHDMKTPLSSIQGYAHMLATDKYQWSDEEIRSFATVMIEKSDYMNQLLEDLSLTYRLRSGNLPVTLSKHNIGVLVTNAVQLTLQHPSFSNTKIRVLLPDEQDVYGVVYGPWLERIIYNIVANAILHNDETTTITIELKASDNDSWKLIFKDNGQGMDSETLQQLFDRYYQGTSTEIRSEGRGLGMAITKELVYAMDGTIHVSSEVGKGTTIELSW